MLKISQRRAGTNYLNQNQNMSLRNKRAGIQNRLEYFFCCSLVPFPTNPCCVQKILTDYSSGIFNSRRNQPGREESYCGEEASFRTVHSLSPSWVCVCHRQRGYPNVRNRSSYQHHSYLFELPHLQVELQHQGWRRQEADVPDQHPPGFLFPSLWIEHLTSKQIGILKTVRIVFLNLEEDLSAALMLPRPLVCLVQNMFGPGQGYRKLQNCHRANTEQLKVAKGQGQLQISHGSVLAI